MAESQAPQINMMVVNNQPTSSSPSLVLSKSQVFDGRLIPDDINTNPGVLV